MSSDINECNVLLPTEILDEVFSYLPIKALERASSTCNEFYEIIKKTNANYLIAEGVSLLKLENSAIQTHTKEGIKTIVATCLGINPNDLPAGSLSDFKELIKNKEELQKRFDALMNAESLKEESTLLELSCLLHAGAAPNNKPGPLNTLNRAVKAKASEDVIRLLLEVGALPDNNPGAFNTLNGAVMANASESVIRLLLEKGALPDNNQGFLNTLNRAVKAGASEDVIRALLEKGALPDNNQGEYNTLTRAVKAGSSENVIRWLLEKGALPDNDQGEYNTLNMALNRNLS